MIRLLVLQIIIVFLFLPNNSIATNQNVFDDAKIYFEKKDFNQSNDNTSSIDVNAENIGEPDKSIN